VNWRHLAFLMLPPAGQNTAVNADLLMLVMLLCFGLCEKQEIICAGLEVAWDKGDTRVRT
jgi:hypothetical protein